MRTENFYVALLCRLDVNLIYCEQLFAFARLRVCAFARLRRIRINRISWIGVNDIYALHVRICKLFKEYISRFWRDVMRQVRNTKEHYRVA